MSTLVLAGAIALDILFGEPPLRLHPVVWMGRFVGWFKRTIPPTERPRDLASGGLLVLTLSAAAAIPCHFITNPIAEAVVLSTTFSHRYFRETLARLATTFATGSLDDKRRAMGELVSRDTTPLSEPELVGAAVETAMENITDSIAAPLLFYLVGGLEAAMAYRVMNTLDAMIGYRGVYFYYGKIAARLDDLFNFIPARLVALLLFVVGWTQRLPVGQAWALFRRDRNKTDSPNAGQTISAAAGLLGVQLSKRECYSLGDGLRPLSPALFAESLRLWQGCVWWSLGLLLALSLVLEGVVLWSHSSVVN
jgi:adenosylcobinamide-phosphate synthase